MFVSNCYVSDQTLCSKCLPLADTRAWSHLWKSFTPLAMDFCGKAQFRSAAVRPSTLLVTWVHLSSYYSVPFIQWTCCPVTEKMDPNLLNFSINSQNLVACVAINCLKLPINGQHLARKCLV